VAEAYDRGILKVIVATCSLAAGINLPARRVIVQEAYMGRDPVGPAMLYIFQSTISNTFADMITDVKCVAELGVRARTRSERHTFAVASTMSGK